MQMTPTRRASIALFSVFMAGGLSGCEAWKDALDDTAWDWTDLLFDRYLIKLDAEPAEVLTTVNNISEAFELEPIHIFSQAVQGFEVDLPPSLVDSIEALDEVEYIIVDNQDSLIPDPEEGETDIPADTIPDGIARIGGPATGVNVSGVQVAIVDTGIDLDHPELNVVGTIDIVAEEGGTDSGGDDLNGHGTHVAGTIGAKGNSVAGVVPGVGLHAVRVLDENGSGTYGGIIAGLEYVLEHSEIKVVNMSLGGQGSTATPAPLQEAIQALEDAGVVVCIAAGNDGADTKDYIPAGYDDGIVVSAYDADGGDNGFAYFSNYGDAVDVAAPGVNITSTYPDGSYAALSGTSMATPHVTGAVAAYMATHTSAGTSAVRSAVVSTGENGYSGQSGNHDEPLLDLGALLAE